MAPLDSPHDNFISIFSSQNIDAILDDVLGTHHANVDEIRRQLRYYLPNASVFVEPNHLVAFNGVTRGDWIQQVQVDAFEVDGQATYIPDSYLLIGDRLSRKDASRHSLYNSKGDTTLYLPPLSKRSYIHLLFSHKVTHGSEVRRSEVRSDYTSKDLRIGEKKEGFKDTNPNEVDVFSFRAEDGHDKLFNDTSLTVTLHKLRDA